ncbi:MAG: hypothetical protein OCC45_05965 [Desulfotalea sp.]
MTIFVGITQDPQETIQALDKNVPTKLASSEVGPFPSSADAEKWMEYMTTHMDNFETIASPVTASLDKLWYGLTVEYPIS